MRSSYASPDRMGSFSDGLIAIVITIMVLELKAPSGTGFDALLPLWPTATSYAVSYLFIAIIWINHHHLVRFVRHADFGLLWLNFTHLFVVSLLPFATSWMARSHLAPVPVACYAAVFVMVNLAYLAFERAVFRQADPHRLTARAKHMAWRRTLATISIFIFATAVAFAAPRFALAMICCALLLYLRPELPGGQSV